LEQQQRDASRQADAYPPLRPGRFEPFVIFWGRHVFAGAVLIPLALSAIFIIRCLAVAEANFNTAKVLIQSSTLNEAMLAILLGTLPFIGLVVSSAIGLLLGESLRSRGYGHRRTLVYYVLGLIVLMGPVLVARSKSLDSMAYWAFHFAFVIAALYGYLLTIRLREAELRKRQTRMAAFLAGCGIMIASFGVSTLASREMWLPLESISLKSGSSISGYVLRSDGDDVIILTEETRLALILKKSEMESRKFCLDRAACSPEESPKPTTSPLSPSSP
jgi:hypothetical protein